MLTNGSPLPSAAPLRLHTGSALARRFLSSRPVLLRVFAMLSAGVAGLCAVHRRFLTRLKPSQLKHIRSMSLSKRPVTLLGSMAFGGRADAQLSAQMVHKFLESGHNELDTAYMYTDGQSETIIGGLRLPATGMIVSSWCAVNTVGIQARSTYITRRRAAYQCVTCKYRESY